MRYVSTRGTSPPASFSQTLLEALAPDGGLYMPEAWPALPARAPTSSYVARAAEILNLYAGEDLTVAEARADAEAAYRSFRAPDVAPLRRLEDGLYLLELFHGPTLAFKDVAMQLLARLYERILARLGRTLTIVCATSGDTGGAAVEAFAGSERIRLLALFPEGRISEVQRRFMTTPTADNVRALAVEGDFDDCQALVKALFADKRLVAETRLTGVNSINWSRILAQTVYYVTSLEALGDEGAVFSVPTGNFGDAFAAEAARRMGGLVRGVVAATNSNDIVARAFQEGRYARGDLQATLSPAMDIQVASNFERLYFELCGRDAPRTTKAFQDFAAGEAVALPTPVSFFTGRSVGEEETLSTMRDARRRYGILIDPHTAVGLAAAPESPSSGAPRVVLSTAHPAKFPDAVHAATGERPELPAGLAGLLDRPERYDTMPKDLSRLAAYVRSFAA